MPEADARASRRAPASLLVVSGLAVLLALSLAVAEQTNVLGLVAVNPTGDAEGAWVTVSGTGNSTTCEKGFFWNASCVAASGTGDARGTVAVSALGGATTCTDRNGCTAVSGGTGEAYACVPVPYWLLSWYTLYACPRGHATEEEDAHGWVAVSRDGNVNAGWLGVTGAGAAEGGIVASGTGTAAGMIAASGTGNASSTCAYTYTECMAVSGTGDAYCEYCHFVVSGTGDATCENCLYAVSGTRTARSDQLAVSGVGSARSDYVAVSGIGDADAPTSASGCDPFRHAGYGEVCHGSLDSDVVRFNATGDAACERDTCVAGSVTGDATCEEAACVAASGTGDATCRYAIQTECVAASGTGDAAGAPGTTFSLTGTCRWQYRWHEDVRSCFALTVDGDGDAHYVAASGTGGAAGPVAASGTGTSTSRTAAASASGDASCTGRDDVCLAASGTGTASCGDHAGSVCVGASLMGNCETEDSTKKCFDVSADGPADGYWLGASARDDAKADWVAVSATEDAGSDGVAVSGTGYAEGPDHVSLTCNGSNRVPYPALGVCWNPIGS